MASLYLQVDLPILNMSLAQVQKQPRPNYAHLAMKVTVTVRQYTEALSTRVSAQGKTGKKPTNCGSMVSDSVLC